MKYIFMLNFSSTIIAAITLREAAGILTQKYEVNELSYIVMHGSHKRLVSEISTCCPLGFGTPRLLEKWIFEYTYDMKR